MNHVQGRISRESPSVGRKLENISSPLVANLKANLDQLEVEKANLFIQGFGDQSGRIQNLTRQIGDIRQQLTTESQNLVDQQNFIDPVSGLKTLYQSQLTLQADLAATQAREGVLSGAMTDYDAALSRLPQAEREFAGLSRDVETDRRVYSLLSERYEEARIQEVGRIPAVRTVDRAHGAHKTRPNIPVNAMLGLVLGLALAFGAALGIEYSTHPSTRRPTLNVMASQYSPAYRLSPRPASWQPPRTPNSTRNIASGQSGRTFLSRRRGFPHAAHQHPICWALTGRCARLS